MGENVTTLGIDRLALLRGARLRLGDVAVVEVTVLVVPREGDVGTWYVNLEAPLRRTAIGLDTGDHHLDVVFAPDLGEARWKDEHELDQAVSCGSMTRTQANAARAEAERAIEWIRRGDHPAIDDRWRTWEPPAGWPVPVLAAGWETLPPALG